MILQRGAFALDREHAPNRNSSSYGCGVVLYECALSPRAGFASRERESGGRFHPHRAILERLLGFPDSALALSAEMQKSQKGHTSWLLRPSTLPAVISSVF